MKVILAHPTGNANVRAAADGFLQAQMLYRFFTTIATYPNNIFDLLSKVGPLKEFSRRRFNPSLKPYTYQYPLFELGRLFSLQIRLSSLIKHEKGIFSIDQVYKKLDKRLSFNLSKLNQKETLGIYAYEDCSELSFKAAKKLGIKCFYDLPIGYWRTARELLEPEIEKWPEWASTMTGFNDSSEKLKRKDDEIKLADLILVASNFTATTLRDFQGPLPTVKVIPYGFPTISPPRTYTNNLNRPLKLLFVGGLSQRKGIANLFAAVDRIGKHVELTLVGHKANNSCIPLEAALKKHNWIPSLPNQDILKLMQAHDLLVFPSLFEGFGLVITEAMSQGTPVITTERTAGPDLIQNEQSGWLVEAGSTESLVEAIEKILHNPKKIEVVGREAREVARRRPWQVYGEELANAIANAI